MEHFIWSLDPIAFSFGPLRVFWYGIFFAIATLSGLQYMKWVYSVEGKDEAMLESMFIYIVIGIVIGARLGHCLFYDPAYYLANPMKIFAVWEGGLASHGGGTGVLLALYFYVKKYKLNYLWILDRVAIPTALFGFFVRLGNFMNSEIIGTPSDLPWAIVFTRVDDLSRHPAQLYESLSYLGIFIILTLLYRIKLHVLNNGFIFGTFLILIFSVRFLVEFVKVKQAAYSSEILISTGQMLSLPFLLLGAVLIFLSLRKRQKKS
ncbi:prolipoprotein diacylglyceryl transferase [Sulfurimonas sp.]|jgi:prolipoprotein diacylglyceryl transferase|uniref:prolipoprotein diacylglyceryl transferase n=1 Tax=Sulfurimonas sp. TaxID=2022749 RepID=UPI0025E67978|nr:prolipoprotein diacylglyceryl transferase [Sulfurimonas sp.]MBT5934239.1 prolipoprotein diacylglyceryl transferase [Sulfurimonas sp.]